MASPIKAKYKEGTDYIVSEWGPDHRGRMHPNYECTRCKFATIDAAKFGEHLDKKNHPWAFQEGAVRETDEGELVESKGYHRLATSDPFEKARQLAAERVKRS
jgi:hypothetical protein